MLTLNNHYSTSLPYQSNIMGIPSTQKPTICDHLHTVYKWFPWCQGKITRNNENGFTENQPDGHLSKSTLSIKCHVITRLHIRRKRLVPIWNTWFPWSHAGHHYHTWYKLISSKIVHATDLGVTSLWLSISNKKFLLDDVRVTETVNSRLYNCGIV